MAMRQDINQASRNAPIQEVSKAELNAMDQRQRAFYVDLEKKGQVRFVSSSENDAKHNKIKGGNREKQEGNRQGPLDKLRDKPVSIVLITGQTLIGTLTEISRFEVVLDTRNSKVVVLKHAMITAEETKISEQGSATGGEGM